MRLSFDTMLKNVSRRRIIQFRIVPADIVVLEQYIFIGLPSKH